MLKFATPKKHKGKIRSKFMASFVLRLIFVIELGPGFQFKRDFCVIAKQAVGGNV